MQSKLSAVSEAIATIDPGVELTIAGFAHTLVPLALVRALINTRIAPIHLSALGEAWAADLLAAAQVLGKVRFSNFMFEGWGRCRNFSRGVEQGRITVKDFSHFAMAMGFIAGGWGLGPVNIRSLAGSDMAPDVDPHQRYPVEPLKPDVALIHVHQADERGNGQLRGPVAAIRDQALAAKRVILSTERIVSARDISRRPGETVVPGFLVSHVVEAPYGAHPTGMFGVYDADFGHIHAYLNASRSPETIDAYLHQFVYGLTHSDYLGRIGMRRLMTLRADPGLGYAAAMRTRFAEGGDGR